MPTKGNSENYSFDAIVNQIPCKFTRQALAKLFNQTAITALTAATGTASNTIADVGSSFSQTTLNNNIKSLAAKINEVIAAQRSAKQITT